MLFFIDSREYFKSKEVTFLKVKVMNHSEKFIAIFLVLIILGSFSGFSSANNSISYSRQNSYGFVEEGDIYFLLEYKVMEKRKPFWFILPIERPPRVHYQKLFLYRLRPEDNQLVQLATLREELPFPAGFNIQYTQFKKTDEGLVIAHRAKFGEDNTVVFDLRIWDISKEKFVELNGQINHLLRTDDPVYQEYFGEYKSPWVNNPGVIGITEVRLYLEDFSEEDWDLPREW